MIVKMKSNLHISLQKLIHICTYTMLIKGMTPKRGSGKTVARRDSGEGSKRTLFWCKKHRNDVVSNFYGSGGSPVRSPISSRSKQFFHLIGLVS